MKADFFDDDAVEDGIDAVDETDDNDGVPIQALSEPGLARMVRKREGMNKQVAQAVSQIELLRSRQEIIEREKKELEELTQMQSEYEAGKKDVMQKLRQSMILLEKEEGQAARMAELLSVMRTRFAEALTELQGINEDAWSEPNFATDLRKAMVLVEDARKTYRKGLAKIDAEGWQRGAVPAKAAALAESLPRADGVPRGFGFWVKVGLAITLPLGAIMIVLFVAWLFMAGWV
jgi:hypothetical protein